MSPLRTPRGHDDPAPPTQDRRREPRTLDFLRHQLLDPDAGQRRWAVVDLGERPEGLDVLVDQMAVESDRTVRDAICAQLVRHDVPEVVDGLIALLSSDDPGTRLAVVEVLARTTTSTARRIPQLLLDPDADVRILTVMVLASLRDPQVGRWLTELVERDVDPNVVGAAIGELVTLVGADSEIALHGVRARFPADPFIGFAVEQALAKLDRESR